jgi:hypothetical protein
MDCDHMSEWFENYTFSEFEEFIQMKENNQEFDIAHKMLMAHSN